MTTPGQANGRTSTLRARLRYWFDRRLAASTVALIGWLAIITFLVAILAGLVITVWDISVEEAPEGASFLEAAWRSLVRTLDPGTFGADEGWRFRLIALLVTLLGMCLVGTLIAIINQGFGQRLEQLRRGRSVVVERGHTLVLGWSPKLLEVVAQLIVANQNQARSCIVILAPRDKVDMEDELRRHVDCGRTRVVCRTGDPSDPNDLRIVNPAEAKSVIVLRPTDGSDAQVVRTVLALIHHDTALDRTRIIAEFGDPKRARAVNNVTDDSVRTVVSPEVISCLAAQVCRQTGLSRVYQELLEFEGAEIYFRADHGLEGLAFGDALLAFEYAVPVGLLNAAGDLELDTPMDRVIGAGERLVVIADDDHDLEPFTGELGELLHPDHPHAEDEPEHLLVLGWNELGPLIIRELDHYVPPGSTALVVYDPTELGAGVGAFGHALGHISIDVETGDTTDEDVIAAALARRAPTHVLVLCYRTDETVAELDARTLLTLMQLRQCLGPAGEDVSVVTELLDVRDVELAAVSEPDDFIVSERLTSLVMAQLAEQPHLEAVYADVFAPGGAEFGLRPVDAYVPLGAPVTFAQVVAAARARGEIAVGFRLEGDGPDAAVVNPPKSAPFGLAPADQVVIIVSERAGSTAPAAPVHDRVTTVDVEVTSAP